MNSAHLPLFLLHQFHLQHRKSSPPFSPILSARIYASVELSWISQSTLEAELRKDTIPSTLLAGKARKLESKRSQRRRRRQSSTATASAQAQSVRFAPEERRPSYIDMASATSGSPQGNSKQPQQQQQHAREESGYLSSTIGSSVPNLHTIGVSRGAALLSNRPLGAGGSAPPAAAAGATAPTSGRQPLADYFQNPNAAPLAERFPGGLPANAAFDSDDEDQHNLLPHVDDNGSDVDFGLNTIGRQNHSMTSNDIVNSDAGFYKLGGGTAGIGQGHVLSSEALAGKSSISLSSSLPEVD